MISLSLRFNFAADTGRQFLCSVLLLVGLLLSSTNSFAQKPAPATQPPREIFVPLEDLNIILETATQRVFLTRKEYEVLLATAKISSAQQAPLAQVMQVAEYNATLEPGRVVVRGKITLEVLREGLQLVPLHLSHVGVRSAMLDGKPAALAHDPKLGIVLPLEGRGSHTLELELTSPLATSAAQQTLQLELPHAPASTFQASVPGNVEVKSGGAVISRRVDEAKNVTHLEISMQHSLVALVLSLNNKQQAKDRIVISRGVMVDEVTAAYERLHATVSLVVLHGAMEEAKLSLPPGFEVTSVESPLVSRWEVKNEELLVSLREPATETVTLNITASRYGAPRENWHFPRLTPRDVESQAFVLGLVLEDRWQSSQVAPKGLIAIDTTTLTNAMPASVFAPGPGLPGIRPIAAYYAPHALFDLEAKFERPAAELSVTTSVFLTLRDALHTAEVGLALQPRAEAAFSCELISPAGWLVQEVRRADGVAVRYERYPQADGSTRVVISFPEGLAAGQVTSLTLKATAVPAGWLDSWTERGFTFPVFKVVGAKRVEGAIALAAEDDLELRPDKIAGLLPLTSLERQRYELGTSDAALAYRHEGELGEATFLAVRKKPSLTAEVYSFFQLKLGALAGHYEIAYDVREASARELQFSLPAETPAEITIRGQGPTVVKETTSSVKEGFRWWRVSLADRQRGLVKLVVDWEMRLPSEEPKGLTLPLLKPQQVEFYSGFVAVEGHAELETTVVKHPRKVDEGELFAAEYQVGPRLVGAFGYLGDTEVQVDVVRHPAHVLPSALAQRAQLLTQISATGLSQTEANYALRTKAPFLEIELPADSELWTITLNGRPTKPQRHDQRLLLSLPSGGADQQHAVNIVFAQRNGSINWLSQLSLVAPRLLVRETPESKPLEIPAADAEWTLLLPAGYELRRSAGSIDTTLPYRTPAAYKFLRWFGMMGEQAAGCSLLPTVQYSRDVGHAASAKSEALSFNMNTLNESTELSAMNAPPPAAEPLMEADGLRAEMAKNTDEKTPDLKERHGLIEKRKKFEQEAKTAQLKGALPAEKKLEPAEKNLLNDFPPQDDAEQNGNGRRAAAVEEQDGSSQRRVLLEGVAGLLIGVQHEPQATAISFTSLGDAPRVEAVVVRPERFALAGWAVGLCIFAAGMLQARASLRQRTGFVIGVLLAATFLPLLITSFAEVGELFDGAFFGAALVGLIYLVAAWWGTIAMCGNACRACCSQCLPWLLGNAAAFLIVVSLAAESRAQPPAADAKPLTLESVLPLLAEDLRPVTVPPDAVIVPYDTADPQGVANAEKVLVPYAKYIELYNLAHPQEKLAVPEAPRPEPPLPYGIGTSQYTAALQTSEGWEVRGTIEINVFTDKPISIPLPLGGGVLASAMLADQPARLQILIPASVPQQAAPAPPPEPVTILHTSGKGRKKFEFIYRFPWTRQGGWRVATGQLPAMGGAGFTITPPNEPAEVRLAGFVDRNAFDTTTAKDEIQSSLDFSGKFTLSWRTKVAEAMIDRGLAAKSRALFDVRQDVLRLTWLVDIEFPRSRRDRLTLQVPAEFLVERVTGPNVRAWQASELGGQRQIEVTLLKEAAEKESLSISLARYGTVGQGEMEMFRVPVVLVPGAELQQGKILLRRDDLLDVRISETQGLTREDADLEPALAQAADIYDSSLLPVRVFQAYRYVGLPVTIRLTASPALAATEAETQMLLNLGERSTSLEASVVVQPRNVPVHRVDLLLPKDLVDFEVEVLNVGGFEKSVAEEAGGRRLTILLREGQAKDFSVDITGKLAARDAEGKLAVPRVQVLNVVRQQGTLVLQADPAYEVRVEKTTGCETIPLASTFGWLTEQKRTNARSALRWQSGDYAATLRAIAKQPNVATQLLHTVKITPRTLEQAILAQFHVTEAGVREVSLLLPEGLKNARVNAKHVRRMYIEPNSPNLPPGFVRLRVELEDEFLGHYRLVLVHDRLLSATSQTIEMPLLDQGSGRRRFLMVESAGRDEVVVEKTTLLEPLVRGQQAFTELTNTLSVEPTQAYVVKQEAGRAALTFSLKQREAVDTSAARIGMAETLFVLDRSGAYRARQEYRVDNSSEQFLEVRLPEQASLWTVTVDGQPAKPVQGAKGIVRIPIIRRARGDADYKVTLIYAGRLAKLSRWGRTDFPFPQTVNINVERSVVRLMLPESQRWFGFDGSLGQPVDETGVQKTAQDYFQRQLSISNEALSSGNKFEVARAQNNLKQLGSDLQLFNGQNAYYYQNDATLSLQYQENFKTLQQGLQQANEQLEEAAAVTTADNRERFNQLFSEQDLQRAKNVVGNDTRNFVNRGDANNNAGRPVTRQSGLNGQWFESNKLNSAKPQGPASKAPSRVAVLESKAEAKPGSGPQVADPQQQQLAQQPSFKGRKDDQLQQQAKEQSGEMRGINPKGAIDEVRDQAVNRYRNKLSLSNEASQNAAIVNPPAKPSNMPSGGGGMGGGGSGGFGNGGFAPQTPALPALDRNGESPALNSNFISLGDHGLASLLLEIPQRGTEYRFVTARGALAITAQNADLATLHGWISLAVAGGVLLIIYVVGRFIAWLCGQRAWIAPALLTLAGFVSVVLSLLPLWGWIALLMGTTLLLRACWQKNGTAVENRIATL